MGMMGELYSAVNLPAMYETVYPVMIGASSYIEEGQLREREDGRPDSRCPKDQVECFRMNENLDMEINNLGVEEEESSEEESQPRTRRKVTDCASSSISDATAATAPSPPPSPAEPDMVNSVMQAAAEIEQQLNRMGVQLTRRAQDEVITEAKGQVRCHPTPPAGLTARSTMGASR